MAMLELEGHLRFINLWNNLNSFLNFITIAIILMYELNVTKCIYAVF